MDFEEIYHKHAKMLFNYILGMCHNEMLAEDIVQTTFLKAIEKIDQFDYKAKFTTWLFQIAKNEYMDYLRKNKKIYHNMCIDDSELIDQTPAVIDRMIEREDIIELRQCIQELPEQYKEIMILRIYGECSYKEIGDFLGKSEVWARVNFFRAKGKIMERYNQKDGKEKNK